MQYGKVHKQPEGGKETPSLTYGMPDKGARLPVEGYLKGSFPTRQHLPGSSKEDVPSLLVAWSREKLPDTKPTIPRE